MEFDAVLLPPRRARMVAQGLWHERTINDELDACVADCPDKLALTALQVEQGVTTRFTYRPNHEWYWFPRQTSTEVSMLKCYDSVTDGSVSRWSFHTACIDPTAPANARCRKNVVVRSYVFF